jgi:hypothetical protein
MTLVLATIVLRTSRPQEAHGFLVAADWESKRILRTMASPGLYGELGIRNRGGRRGFRGLVTHGGRIWLASSDTIYLLDPRSLALQGMLSHRFMGGIHDLLSDGDGVWVTCASADGIFKIDADQQVLEDRWVKGKPRHDLRIHFDESLDTLHVNSVFRHEGELYFYAAFTGEVYRVTPGGVELAVAIEPMCHNVFRTEEGFFRSVSPLSEIRWGARWLALPRVGHEGEFTRPGWLRGFSRLPGGNVLVGSSPARIFEVDLERGEVADQLVFKEDPNWTISGIVVLGQEAFPNPLPVTVGTPVDAPTHHRDIQVDSFAPHEELARLAYAKFGAAAYADALDLFRVCLQFEEHYSQEALDGLRFHLALCFFFLGHHERALGELEVLAKYAVSGGVPASLPYYQALCQERLGRRDLAREALCRVPAHGLDPALRREIEQTARRLDAAGRRMDPSEGA